jgi:hypothetical protein
MFAGVHSAHGCRHAGPILAGPHDLSIPEAGAFYVMDRRYLDLTLLFSSDQPGGFYRSSTKQRFTDE